MFQDIIHQEIFTHSTKKMCLYIISNECYINKEDFQNLIQEKTIQTIFLLENQVMNMNFEQITQSLVGKTLDEKYNILFNEIYSAKKNIGFILTQKNNESICFFASYMILKEKKNEQWLNEQNFYKTLLKIEQEELITLIKNNSSKLNDIFLETYQIEPQNQGLFSEVLITTKPNHENAIDLNPPLLKSSFEIQFPQISIESMIFQTDQQINQSNVNNKIVSDIQSLNLNPIMSPKPSIEPEEQEFTILELAPPIKFQSFYQKYSIKCFK